MNKTPLHTAIATACYLGLSATTASAVDISVTELHFTGGGGAGFPVDCSGGPSPAGPCYGTTGGLSNATGDFGFFESVDPFYAQPWAAAGTAYFDGFDVDGTSSEDTETLTDAGNITNGAPADLATFDFGTISQTFATNGDGNGATNDFQYSGTSAQGAFTYDFTLTDTQVAWGTLFNWNTSIGISVLAIFDCGASGTNCVPVSTLMGNGPFAGQGAIFTGTGSNFAPVAVDDPFGAQVGVLTAFTVLTNDTDRDGLGSPTITLPSATSTKGGTLTVNGSTIEYTSVGLTAPDTDTFDYSITDAAGLDSVLDATVSVTLSSFANNEPVAIGDAVNVGEDASVDIAIADVSSDADNPGQGQTITFASSSLGVPTNGAATLNGANTVLTYTPDADYNGPDSFTFFVNDGIADSLASATITVTVDPVNDPLVCVDVAQGTGIDTDLDIATSDLVAACTDVDSDALTYVSVGAPSQGGAIIDDGLGTLTFTPAAGFEGAEIVSYTVSDGTVTADANINIQVGGELLGNFTMLQADGQRFGGTNDIIFTFADTVDLDDDATLNDSEDDLDFNLGIETEGTPFFGAVWTAHHIRIFGPGTYSFDSGCTATEVETTGCIAGSAAVSGPSMSMTVPVGMVGAHMLFDWNGNNDLVVVNVWERNAVWDQLGATSPVNQLWALGGGLPPEETTTWELVSRDVNGDGFNGTPMVAGPFKDNYVNFNHKPAGAGEEVPPLDVTAPSTSLGSSLINPWVMIVGLFSLLGFRCYVKK